MTRSKSTFCRLSCLEFLKLAFFFLLASQTLAQALLESYIENGSVLLHSPEGNAILSHNSRQALVPASLLKIPLAHVTLSSLGEDFRFETHFYRNASDDLLIRGLGDPFLVSEEISKIAEALSHLQLEKVRRLVIDDSAFESDLDLPQERTTIDPYAARNSAMAVNFNTVNLAWDTNGSLISGETQTPLTPLARELGAQLPAGEAQRINLGSEPVNGLQQAQQLFSLLLGETGILVADRNFYHESLSDEWTLFYRHISSRSLREILEGMLRFSNNFIANQLFLTLGTINNGYPTSATNARAILQQQLAKLYGPGFGKDPNSLLMLEGSGLSRTQRVTAEGMMHILEAFKPYADLLPEVNGFLYKSGTMTGIYNFAGYIPRPDGLYPYVIMTNQNTNNRDKILQVLAEKL
ncbi:MAG: hypothetical protein CMQ41_11815 [Gammaproteobacteria bacterium]|nr:hypothetical protein [Gammaproteobacteria bacterium]